MTPDSEKPPVRFEADSISKRFGATQALSNASIQIQAGELVGLAGHNGAGKSTLLRVIAGLTTADEGSIRLAGRDMPIRRGYSPKMARDAGIRIVHQELSLCASLRVDESAAVVDRSIQGIRWRRGAWERLRQVLDEVFPGHGIRAHEHIADLSIARRQMVEIANAILPSSEGIALLILDEPTSSLDADATASLYRWLRESTSATSRLSVIVTTHRLHEMLTYLDRVYVMRDGEVLNSTPTAKLTRDQLIADMGGAAELQDSGPQEPLTPPSRQGATADPGTAARDQGAFHRESVAVSIRSLNTKLDDVTIEVHGGEIVGLAGLEGHGQRALLEAIFRAATARGYARRQSIELSGRVAYVSGDRATSGVFKFWSVAENISIASLSSLARGGWISRTKTSKLVDTWSRRLQIRGADQAPILSLSGGNQQKALAARAVATRADVILLDDPTRGVDQGTKEQMYTIFREEADKGRCAVWYSTENEELINCDRIYVLRDGQIVDVLEGEERTEARIIAASFRQEAA